MTEKEAWLALAQAWNNPRTSISPYDGKRYVHITNPFDSFKDTCLCDGTQLDHGRDYDIRLPESMCGNLRRFSNGNAYYWPQTKVGAIQRTWACLFLAAMCE